MLAHSLDLDRLINLAHEYKRGEEPDRPGKQAKGHGDHQHVGEVNHATQEPLQAELGVEVPDRIHEEVATRARRVEKTADLLLLFIFKVSV